MISARLYGVWDYVNRLALYFICFSIIISMYIILYKHVCTSGRIMPFIVSLSVTLSPLVPRFYRLSPCLPVLDSYNDRIVQRQSQLTDSTDSKWLTEEEEFTSSWRGIWLTLVHEQQQGLMYSFYIGQKSWSGFNPDRVALLFHLTEPHSFQWEAVFNFSDRPGSNFRNSTIVKYTTHRTSMTSDI